MDKAEQPMITQALKPCPEAEAIAQGIADRSRWKKTTDNYARIYQAAYAGAIAALNTRTTSLAAQDGLVEALERCAQIVEQWNHRQNEKVDDIKYIVRNALSAIKGDKS